MTSKLLAVGIIEPEMESHGSDKSGSKYGYQAWKMEPHDGVEETMHSKAFESPPPSVLTLFPAVNFIFLLTCLLNRQ